MPGLWVWPSICAGVTEVVEIDVYVDVLGVCLV